jgi:hypothetical protein
MSTAIGPTVRDWLAAHVRGPRELPGRQLEVLEQARLRGYLFDPDPEPFDFLGSDMSIRDRHWPEVCERDRPGHWAEWLERCEAAGDHRWGYSVEEGQGEPTHFGEWQYYCFRVLGRPSVTAGRFLPEHWHEDTFGVLVCANSAGDYRPARRGWHELVKLASAAALGHYPEAPWLYFDGNVLAVQVAAADAELLAAQLRDRLEEVLDLDEPDFERS